MVATCNQLTTVMNRLKKSFFSNFSYFATHAHWPMPVSIFSSIKQRSSASAYVTDSQVSFLFNPSLSQYYCQREPSNTGEPGWWTGFCFLSHPPSALVSTQLWGAPSCFEVPVSSSRLSLPKNTIFSNLHFTWLNMYLWVYHMWQSQVEIKHYSVVYFTRIAAFEVL